MQNKKKKFFYKLYFIRNYSKNVEIKLVIKFFKIK